MKKSITVRLCRAGVVGALYAGLTLAFGSLASGPLQIRPAEALCVLPLLFPESAIGLFVGCALANIISAYGLIDVILGSTATLVAGVMTAIVGKTVKKGGLSILLGGIFPVVINALVIPLVILLASPSGETKVYYVMAGEIFLTQLLWVYGLGAPLFSAIKKMREKPTHL